MHFQRRYNLTRGSVVMAVTTLTFDPSILELYWPLAFGAQIVIASTATQKRGDRMLELLDEVRRVIRKT